MMLLAQQPGAGGISLSGGQATDVASIVGNNLVQNNIVGLNVAGTAAVPNGRVGTFGPGGPGISLFNASENRILDNILSGNLGGGITISGANALGRANDNLVQGNTIGMNAARTPAIGNEGDGILVSSFNQQAVATGPDGSTSEFTACRQSGAGQTSFSLYLPLVRR